MKSNEENNRLQESSGSAFQGAKERNYWLNKLAGDYEKSTFPFDSRKDSDTKPVLKSQDFVFPGELNPKLMRLSNNSDIRLFLVLMAGVVLLLAKYTGDEDIVIGAPIYKQDMAGDFINTILALRTLLKDGMSFKQLLLVVSETNREAMANVNYPLETLSFDLDMPFSNNGFPLFDVAVLLENIHDNSYLSHLDLEFIFNFAKKGNTVEGSVQYNSLVYKKETVTGIIAHYTHLMGSALNDIDANISGLYIVPDEEIRWLIEDFNSCSEEYSCAKTLNQLFREQVERAPDNIAVSFEKNSLTYSELAEKIDKWAGLLIKRGVHSETLVGVLLEHSIELVTAVLAVLKAGGAYMPLDPENSFSRLDHCLKDSQTEHLISCKKLEKKVQFQGDLIHPEDFEVAGVGSDNLPTVNPENLAYVIYTSGTTGGSKGVAVEHRAVVNYVCWAAATYLKGENLNFPLYSSISFDLTVTSIFTPLITGNTIIVYKGDEHDLLIEKVIDDKKTGVVKLTPSHLYTIKYKKIENSPIKCFVVGGEIFDTRIARYIYQKFQGNVEIYNEYGPTESTVGCLVYKYDPTLDTGRSVPIGVPVNNAQVYILDRNLRPVPKSVTGEIYISGDGTARGYLNSPVLTREKFVSNPFLTGKEMYKSGDLARMLPGGNIEFLGRLEDQVKIRGYRIELGEIEQRLLKHADVSETVVIARDWQEKSSENEKHDQYLCAYFVASKEIQVSTLRDYLAGHLPGYMVPLFFVQLEAIPLTPNGKINRKALPVPEIKKEKDYVAPRNEIEKKLVDIWSEVLKLDASIISIDANFFELGGQSLKQVFLVSLIHKELNVKVPQTEIFKRQTIRELAVYIKEAVTEEYISIEPVEEKEYYPLSSAQRRLYVLREITEDTLYNVPLFLKVAQAIDPGKLENAFLHLIKRHEAYRTSFILLDGGEPVQRIHKNVGFKIECFDLQGTGAQDLPSHKHAVEEILSNFVRPFDLAEAPLLRVGLIKLANDNTILLFDVHHIIGDGVSTEIMANEFVAVYSGRELHELPRLHIQYKDFAVWENSDSRKERMQKQKEFWLKEFEGGLPVLNVPTDFPRPDLQSFLGSDLTFALGTETTAQLHHMAEDNDLTLFIILAAAFNIFLSKISGQEDIVVGMSAAARSQSEVEPVVGIFVNTLLLRNYPRSEKKVSEFLEEVKERSLKCLENQDYQFDNLLDALQYQRDASRNPMFDIMFEWFSMYRNVEVDSGIGLPVVHNPYLYKKNIAKFDMTWSGRESEQNIFFIVEYATNLYKKKSILKFIDYFKKIITVILISPDTTISQIDIISKEEKEELIKRNRSAKGKNFLHKNIGKKQQSQEEENVEFDF